MDPDQLLADYLADRQARGTPHELKVHANRRHREGMPVTMHQHFLYRRLVEAVGETKAKALIKGSIEAMELFQCSPTQPSEGWQTTTW